MELHAFKHEVPGSSPGGSNNFRGAIAQLVEHGFHQILSSQFRCYVYGHREFHQGCSRQTERLHRVPHRKTSNRLMDIILDGGGLSSRQIYFKKVALGNFLSV
jgi:hypothetical protein